MLFVKENEAQDVWLCTKKRKMRRMTWINYGSNFEWSLEFSCDDLWILVERKLRGFGSLD